MPTDIILRNLSTPPVTASGPVIATESGWRDGTRPDVTPQGVIFADSFDNQPDWTSAMHSSDQSQHAATHTLPAGWDAMRQDPVWAPSTGHPDRHEVIEITDATIAENPNRARGGTGKSFVKWQDSDDSSTFNSDGLLVKVLPEGYYELYVECYVNFSNEAIAAFDVNKLGSGKFLRILGHDDPTNINWQDYWEFFQYNSPKIILSFHGETQYGIRNQLSVYRDGSAEDINNTLGIPSGLSFINGDLNAGYWPEAVAGQGLGGTDPQLTDYKYGGVIDGSKTPDSGVEMQQVFGDETQWIRVGLYVKMNSAPGVADGKIQQFFDGHRILSLSNMVICPSDGVMKPLNFVALGGNDNFHYFPDSERYEHWYAIDDVVIRDSLPQEFQQ